MSTTIFFVFGLVIFANFCESCKDQDEFVTVETSLGSVRGITLKTRENRKCLAFRGIKYAEAPTGENRFQPPIPIKKWTGIYDATKDGNFCPQQPDLVKNSPMSEDCLIVNVYTKDLIKKRPVLVYIHGGGYTEGGSHSEHVVGPQYLMDKDIVLVTLNYRLGPFGFLSTGTKEAPGNNAFKDQVLALKWIHEHIESFGGDPNAVTIFGQSAGGFSVTLHMVSPMSQGLFHGVIAMSGAEANHFNLDNKHWTKKLATELSCPVDDPKLLVECLRNVPADKIIETCDSWDISRIPILRWSFEIEEDFGQERFITKDPIKKFYKGEFSRVPVLTGITKDEFGPVAYDIYYNMTKLLNGFNENFDVIAPELFLYESGTENSLKISKSLREFYLNNKKVDETNIDKFSELYADAIIGHGVHRFVDLVRKYTDVYYYRTDYIGRYSHAYNLDGKPFELYADAIIGHGVHRFVDLVRKYTDVYYYRTDYIGRYSHAYNLDGKPFAVFHTDDLGYLFVNNGFAPMFKKSDPENIMVERLTSWWTTFAKTGNPNDKTNEWTSAIDWTPSNADELKTLYINTECKLDKAPYQDRYHLWDELFPINLE